MKKILFVLAIMLPMIVFSSCSKDDDEKSNETLELILGTWEVSQVDTGKGYQDWILEKTSASFKKDGTYSGKGYFGNGEGTYEMSGKTITCYVSGKEYVKYDIIDLTSSTCELKMYVSGSSEDIKIKCVKK